MINHASLISRRALLTISLSTFTLLMTGCYFTATKIVIQNEGSGALTVEAEFTTEQGSNGFLKADIAVGRWGLLKFLTLDDSGTEVDLEGTYSFDGGSETAFTYPIILGQTNVIVFQDSGPVVN